VKDPIVGFLDRSGPPAFSFIPGYVVDVPLSELLGGPSGTTVLHPNPLDVAAIGTKLLKLRADTAGGAPEAWKTLAGFKPVTVANPQTGDAVEVGPFWRPDYRDRRREGMANLAAVYDGLPLLRSVVKARTGLVFAEGLIFYNHAALAAAGWTWEAYAATFTEDEEVWPWKTTRPEIALNPCTAPGAPAGFAETVLGLQGPATMVGNNSLRYPMQGGLYPPLLAALKASPLDKYFQTAQLADMGDAAGTFQEAYELDARQVELPNGYRHGAIPLALLEEWQAKFAA